MTGARITLAALLFAATAAAQAQVPPERAAKIRALGQSMDPAAGTAPYRDALGPEFFEGMTISRGIAYGSDPKHALDVYMRDGAEAAKRPVLVFVHGGGFRGGSRSGQPYPDNIPAWAVHEGMVAVSIDYRLAPENLWPAGANDLSSALQWVRTHIARYGGDPDRIVLLGHSAGANHVADYIAHAKVQGEEIAGVKGAALLSPLYVEAMTEGAPHIYYGNDAALQTADPLLAGLRASDVPLFFATAEFDPDNMQEFGEKARARLCEKAERCPGFVHLADHNHFTEGMALGTEDKSLSGPLVAWMKASGIF